MMKRNLKFMKTLLTLLFALCIFAQSAFSATVTLAWDPSPDPPVTYRIIIDGSITNDVGDVLTCQVQNLIAGQTYTFTSYAVDTNGFWSDPSNTVSYTPSEGSPPPPILLSQDGVVTTSNVWRITVSWKPVLPAYAVTNYLMIVKQGTALRTNHVGTNLISVMTVQAFNTTEVFLQSQNNQGFSPLVQVGNYRKPGSSKFLKVTQP